jgi:acetyl-CoA synthetase (ADP-forming)
MKLETRELFDMARASGRAVLDEPTSKRILAAYGIATPQSIVIEGRDEVEAALAAVPPPVVLKIISSDAVHKSDVGGVRLGLADRTAVTAALDDIRARSGSMGIEVAGYLIEEMVPKGHEVMIGAVRDARFGPLVMFGIGGVFVEILGDVSLRLCPITRRDAIEMIHELRGAPALFGARGGVAGCEDSLVDALLALGGAQGLMLEQDNVGELDINPLILGAHGVVAVDGRIALRSQ